MTTSARHYNIIRHHETSGFASRTDLAILTDGKITHIFTIGVKNGNTCGALNAPFSKGMTLDEVHKVVEEMNWSDNPDAVCRCGSTESYHMVTAACHDESTIWEVSLSEALELAFSAKREPVAMALFKKLRRMQDDSGRPILTSAQADAKAKQTAYFLERYRSLCGGD